MRSAIGSGVVGLARVGTRSRPHRRRPRSHQRHHWAGQRCRHRFPTCSRPRRRTPARRRTPDTWRRHGRRRSRLGSSRHRRRPGSRIRRPRTRAINSRRRPGTRHHRHKEGSFRRSRRRSRLGSELRRCRFAPDRRRRCTRRTSNRGLRRPSSQAGQVAPPQPTSVSSWFCRSSMQEGAAYVVVTTLESVIFGRDPSRPARVRDGVVVAVVGELTSTVTVPCSPPERLPSAQVT